MSEVTAEDVRRWVADYARDMRGLPALLARFRPYVFPFESVINRIPGGVALLDVGCGSGLFLFLLARAGKLRQGQGIDNAAAVVAAAEAAHAREGTGVRFVACGDFEAWPQATFDIVTMIDVIHHVPPVAQRRFFEEACARVKPGGLFLFKDMADKPFWVNWGNRLHDMLIARQFVHYVDFAAAESWAASCGLAVIERDRHDLYVYGHVLRVFRKRAA